LYSVEPPSPTGEGLCWCVARRRKLSLSLLGSEASAQPYTFSGGEQSGGDLFVRINITITIQP